MGILLASPNLKDTITYSSPSNIAFVKYWGKFGRQFPLNPSISMTLDKCRTITSVGYVKGNGTIKSFDFDGNPNSKFKTRLQNFIDSIHDILPQLKEFDYVIKSSNSFPHSAGIASSASAMSALCACLVKLVSIEDKNYSFELDNVSYLSRLASGSACRSVYSQYACWGASPVESIESIDDQATQLSSFHKSFSDLNDSILIISDEEKEVSSSLGHSIFNTHPFKESRIKQANDNFVQIISAMEKGDFSTFGEILENEALTLHALMMSSYPSFLLLKPNSVSVIEKVRKFRSSNDIDLYFTIDAGPNIHLIYPESSKNTVQKFIDDELKELCTNNLVIHDKIGAGLQKYES